MRVTDLLPEAISAIRGKKKKRWGGGGVEVGNKATSRRVNANNVTCLYTRTDKNHKLRALGFRRRSDRPKVFCCSHRISKQTFVLTHLFITKAQEESFMIIYAKPKAKPKLCLTLHHFFCMGTKTNCPLKTKQTSGWVSSSFNAGLCDITKGLKLLYSGFRE